MSRGLLSRARLNRRQLIAFALASAALNGVITASVGTWLAQTYATYQARHQSVESITHMVYERRTRAGMVASSIRRGAEVEEVRHRKRAYDEAYVDWNKNVMLNLFAIREISGELKLSKLEPFFEDGLVAAMADVDRCITQAYDRRLAVPDPGVAKAVLDACRMSALHQFTLDCGSTFTNELYKLTKLTFIPFSGEQAKLREAAEANIRTDCTRPEPPPAETSATPAPPAPGPAISAAPPTPPLSAPVASTPASK